MSQQTVLKPRTKVKPKVGIIGEFWAMTTEGEGNYALQNILRGARAAEASHLMPLLHQTFPERQPDITKPDNAEARTSVLELREKPLIHSHFFSCHKTLSPRR